MPESIVRRAVATKRKVRSPAIVSRATEGSYPTTCVEGATARTVSPDQSPEGCAHRSIAAIRAPSGAPKPALRRSTHQSGGVAVLSSTAETALAFRFTLDKGSGEAAILSSSDSRSLVPAATNAQPATCHSIVISSTNSWGGVSNLCLIGPNTNRESAVSLRLSTWQPKRQAKLL
jgi:hypothetical protein